MRKPQSRESNAHLISFVLNIPWELLQTLTNLKFLLFGFTVVEGKKLFVKEIILFDLHLINFIYIIRH